MAVSRHGAMPIDLVKLVHHFRGRNPVSLETSMDEGYQMSMGVDTTGAPPGIGPSSATAESANEDEPMPNAATEYQHCLI